MKFTSAIASLGLIALLSACGSSSTTSSTTSPTTSSSQATGYNSSGQQSAAVSSSPTIRASSTASVAISKSASPSANVSTASPSLTSVAASSQAATNSQPLTKDQPSASPSQHVPTVTENSVAAPTSSPQVVAPIATAPAENSGKNPSGIPAEAQLVTTVTERQGISPRVATILTPSGNIGCDIIEGQGIGCGVISLSKEAPRTPGSVNMPGWFYFTPAQGATYDTGRTDAPYFKLKDSETVAYGQLVYFDIYVCNSQTDGLTCANTQTGHGMFLSREGIKTF